LLRELFSDYALISSSSIFRLMIIFRGALIMLCPIIGRPIIGTK